MTTDQKARGSSPFRRMKLQNPVPSQCAKQCAKLEGTWGVPDDHSSEYETQGDT